MNVAEPRLQEQEIEAFLAKGVNLPAQPKVLTEIDALAAKDDVSLRAIASLVGKDAGLTARIFKVVHSPLFGIRKEVDSLDQAINMVGLKPALSIIKSAALRDSIGGDTKTMDAFWDRANDIAVLAALIAKKQRDVLRLPPEHAHMSGLFHDCGVPILMQRIPGYCSDLARTWPNLEEEDARHKTSHAVVGYMMAKNWKLPEAVCQAIRHHHDSAHALEAEHSLIAILLMATHLRDLCCGYGDASWATIEPAILAELGISQLDKQEFTDELLHQFRESLS
jgi:putative nucleotidyltransferase with HDIG domain